MKTVIVFTGAGLSQESGIPTFRDSITGLWENHKIEDVASQDGWQANKELVLNFYKDRYQNCQKVQPKLLLYKNETEKRAELKKMLSSSGQNLILVPEVRDIQKTAELLFDNDTENIYLTLSSDTKETEKILTVITTKILEPIAEHITSKIKQGVNQRNTDIDQNISFILSGGNYIYLTDSLRKKIDKSFSQKTPTPPTKTNVTFASGRAYST
jgi:NAD-dependent SIR2 family protein deacetylase